MEFGVAVMRVGGKKVCRPRDLYPYQAAFQVFLGPILITIQRPLRCH
jgi:hypothetical protein